MAKRMIRRVYATGGQTDPNQQQPSGWDNFMNNGGFSTAAGAGAGIVDGLDQGTPYGRKRVGTSIASGALSGAATGAAFGPWGAAVGAVVGGATGWLKGAAAKKKEDAQIKGLNMQRENNQRQAASARVASDPGLVAGYQNSGYYAMGGGLRRGRLKYAYGGDPTGPGPDKKNIPVVVDAKDPFERQRVNTIDSLSRAWGVPSRDITSQSAWNYGDSATKGSVPRNTTYGYKLGTPQARSFINYYPGVNKGYAAGDFTYADGGDLRRRSGGANIRKETGLPPEMAAQYGYPGQLADGGPISGHPTKRGSQITDTTPYGIYREFANDYLNNGRLAAVMGNDQPLHTPEWTKSDWEKAHPAAAAAEDRRQETLMRRAQTDVAREYLNSKTAVPKLNNFFGVSQFAEGGGIHIKPENRGKFTAWASAHGMGVQEAASHVMANKDDYSTGVVKMANFAKNFGGKKAMGGWLNPSKKPTGVR